jgi:uncharacterized protein YheU (UPF0270 family)
MLLTVQLYGAEGSPERPSNNRNNNIIKYPTPKGEGEGGGDGRIDFSLDNRKESVENRKRIGEKVIKQTNQLVGC